MCQEQAKICTNQTDGHGTRCVHTDAPPPAPSEPGRPLQVRSITPHIKREDSKTKVSFEFLFVLCFSVQCMGTRDYRPFDLGNCSYYCRTASKADGLFIENAHGVVLKNVTFEYELPRKPWYGKCLVVSNRSQ